MKRAAKSHGRRPSQSQVDRAPAAAIPHHYRALPGSGRPVSARAPSQWSRRNRAALPSPANRFHPRTFRRQVRARSQRPPRSGRRRQQGVTPQKPRPQVLQRQEGQERRQQAPRWQAQPSRRLQIPAGAVCQKPCRSSSSAVRRPIAGNTDAWRQQPRRGREPSERPARRSAGADIGCSCRKHSRGVRRREPGRLSPGCRRHRLVVVGSGAAVAAGGEPFGG